MNRVGIQIGHDHLVAVALAADGQVTDVERAALSPNVSYDSLLVHIVAVYERLQRAMGLRSVSLGVTVKGRLEGPNGTISECPVACLVGRQLANDLSFQLRRDIRVESEANCFTLAEATLGAGRRLEMVVGLMADSPMQGGLVINGQIWRGRSARAGAWNRLPGMAGINRPGRTHRAERQFRRTMFGLGTLLDPDIIVMAGLPPSDHLFRGIYESGVPLAAPALGTQSAAIGAALLGV
jgi:hypothetical protein